MAIHVHEGDLPEGLDLGVAVAIDTETLGLNPLRDRLCLVQLSGGDGTVDLVQIRPGQTTAPQLTALFADRSVQKLFHFARFDLASLYHAFGVMPEPVYCTKVASRLTRTYTDRHGLKDLVKELLGIDLSKQQQSSDWGGPVITDPQRDYAASDVRYLHRLRAELSLRLEREGRTAMAQACFEFLPTRALLDIAGWAENDIFSHM